MKLLFVCTAGLNRSTTAASLYSQVAETKSIGINGVTEELLDWADKIFVMEQWHKNSILQRFDSPWSLGGAATGSYEYKIVVLDIPDIYGYNSPELQSILTIKINAYISDIYES